jgi:hypothetical protein
MEGADGTAIELILFGVGAVMTLIVVGVFAYVLTRKDDRR